MKLGFVSAILPDQSLEQIVRTAAEIGYDGDACKPHGSIQSDRV